MLGQGSHGQGGFLGRLRKLAMRRLRKACQSAVVEGFVDEGRQREALASSRDEGVNLAEGFVAEPQRLLEIRPGTIQETQRNRETVVASMERGSSRLLSSGLIKLWTCFP